MYSPTRWRRWLRMASVKYLFFFFFLLVREGYFLFMYWQLLIALKYVLEHWFADSNKKWLLLSKIFIGQGENHTKLFKKEITINQNVISIISLKTLSFMHLIDTFYRITYWKSEVRWIILKKPITNNTFNLSWH